MLIWHIFPPFQEHSVSDMLKVKVPLDRNVRFKTSHMIDNASEDDEGTYFCKVRNDLGTDERQAELTLMSKYHSHVIIIVTSRGRHGISHPSLFDSLSRLKSSTWWRHQMEKISALLAICAVNSPVPVNSPHKGQWRGALMFSLICVWINGWVNNRKAGDLRRYRAYYDVIVMNMQAQHYLSFVRVSGGFPSQKISYAERVSKPWPQNVPPRKKILLKIKKKRVLLFFAGELVY